MQKEQQVIEYILEKKKDLKNLIDSLGLVDFDIDFDMDEIKDVLWIHTESEILWNTDKDIIDLNNMDGESYSMASLNVLFENDKYFLVRVWDDTRDVFDLLFHKSEMVTWDELDAGKQEVPQSNKITAICELQDQDVGIEEVRIIDNTLQSVKAFDDEMQERMGWLGYQNTYYNAIISNPDSMNQANIYEWMRNNQHNEI